MIADHAQPQPRRRETRRVQLVAPPLLVGIVDVAAMLAVSPRTVRRLAASGEFPVRPIKLGKRCCWRVQDLAAWVGDGCPSTERWGAMRDGQAGGRGR